MSEISGMISARIFAVIVLYKVAPRDCSSFQTLQAAIKYASASKAEVKILFYDNTPGGQPTAPIPQGIRYKSSGGNDGLAVAYNRAIELAQEEGCDWLLTLDQDTKLPIDFVSKLSDSVRFVTPLSNVAAVVPQIYDGSRMVSPNMLSFDIFPKFYPEGFIGTSSQMTSAINSASTIRIDALKAVGGYDARFWLDYSDAILYHRLYSKGMRVFIAGNIRVDHELSVLDMKQGVSTERYNCILAAESAFWDERMGKVADLALLLRFMYRLCYKLWITRAGFSHFKISLRFFCRRLFYSRRRRMRDWERSAAHRLT